jgi:hypothetical protein
VNQATGLRIDGEIEKELRASRPREDIGDAHLNCFILVTTFCGLGFGAAVA